MDPPDLQRPELADIRAIGRYAADIYALLADIWPINFRATSDGPQHTLALSDTVGADYSDLAIAVFLAEKPS